MGCTLERYGNRHNESWGRFLTVKLQRIDMSKSTDEERERPDIEAQVAFNGDFNDEEEDDE